MANQLLAQIKSNTEKYLAFLNEQSLPEPTFEHGHGLDPGVPLPAATRLVLEAAIEATDELHHLLLGPSRMLMSCSGDQYLMLAIQYILRYRIAHKVPTEGEISFDELGESTGLEGREIVQFLRFAATRHVFHEPRKGYIMHTAASKILLSDPLLQNFIDYCAQEIWPSVTRTVDATEKWPGSEEPNQSGFTLANNSTTGPFEVIKRDPARTSRFTGGVAFSHSSSLYNTDHLLTSYDFSKAKVLVDVGGSHGGISIAIASRNPGLKCVVQDLPETISGLDQHIPSNLKDRVVGMEHDFFSPQPVKDADIFLLRWILHDWSDKYCVKILRALIPALKAGTRVLLNEVCMPEPGELSIARERSMRAMDLSLKAFNNARVRDAEEWASLFTQAAPRFAFLGIRIAPGSSMALIVAEWN